MVDQGLRSGAGLTRRRWTGLALVWLAALAIFAFPFVTARRAIIHEIRSQAMGVAIAAAAGISADDLAQIHAPGDATKDAYVRVQNLLSAISSANPDVRYVYIMRRSLHADAGETDYEYVVDQAARDADEDGALDRTEMSEAAGTPYDASGWPELVRAWRQPTADTHLSHDPPYPDLMSGYAPVKDARGRTVAIVGVDITAGTVRRKLAAVVMAMAVGWVVLSLLISAVLHLYYLQRNALERNRSLMRELSEGNEMLTHANKQLGRQKEQFEKELKLARRIQSSLLPKALPKEEKVVFDEYHLSCDLLGGDVFDAFSAAPNRVAIYMADVAGRGTEAALIAGLLKSAIESLRRQTLPGDGGPGVLLQPDKVMLRLNEMLVREISDYEFVTLTYAVLDLSHRTFTFANAGHPTALRYDAVAQKAVDWVTPTGPALGLFEKATYTANQRTVAPGDKIVFFTDGLTGVLDTEGREFGRERLHRLVEENGDKPPAEITAAVRKAFEEHRGAQRPRDDFSLLVAEIR